MSISYTQYDFVVYSGFTEKTRALQDIFLSYVRGLNRIVDANASKGDA